METSTSHLLRASTSSALVLFALLGCSDPNIEDAEPGCVVVADEVCPDEAGEIGEESETDGPPEPRELDPGECRFNDSTADPVAGWRYECEGELYTRMTFDLVGQSCADVLGQDWCAQHHPYSLNTYANAEVIACCGDYDPEQAAIFKEFCTYDVYQQLCISLGERLEASINAGDFDLFDGQAIELHNWIVDHYTECFKAFELGNTATVPQMSATWELGDFGLLKNVALHIEAPSEVLGVNIPSDPSDRIACTDANGNNDVVFEDNSGGGGVSTALTLASSLDAALFGPELFGTEVSAYARFEAGCSPRGCPEVSLSIDEAAGVITLTQLDLYEDDPVRIGNGSFSLVADQVRIDLWTQALGHARLDPETGAHLGWTIPAGAAQFMIAGLSAELGANRLMAQNTRAIELREVDGGWSMSGLELTFIDGSGAAWTVHLDPSDWRG